MTEKGLKKRSISVRQWQKPPKKRSKPTQPRSHVAHTGKNRP